MTNRKVDILIIGGGLTGAALMLALLNQGYEVLLLDSSSFSTDSQAPSRNFDARTLALSPASIKILSQLQVWSLVADETCPIKAIHVSQQGHFGVTQLHAEGGDALGAIIDLQKVSEALYQLLPADKILAPAQLLEMDVVNQFALVRQGAHEFKIFAQLFIAADGGQSTVRRCSKLSAKIKLYNQSALVANIGLQRSHRHVAYERFARNGPLAMLPMTHQRSAMVWCLPPDEAKHMQELDETHFLKQLQLAFGYRLGRFIKVGKRSLFPLQEIIMPQQVLWPIVFIGNAAHTLHPAAAQGFNLGLRDVAALAQCILQYGLNPEMLKEYQLMRQVDQRVITRFTDSLVQVFGSQLPGLALGRGLGLVVMDNSMHLQQLLVRYAGGYGGIVPDLVCGIALEKQ